METFEQHLARLGRGSVKKSAEQGQLQSLCEGMYKNRGIVSAVGALRKALNESGWPEQGTGGPQFGTQEFPGYRAAAEGVVDAIAAYVRTALPGGRDAEGYDTAVIALFRAIERALIDPLTYSGSPARGFMKQRLPIEMASLATSPEHEDALFGIIETGIGRDLMRKAERGLTATIPKSIDASTGVLITDDEGRTALLKKASKPRKATAPNDITGGA